MLGVAVERKVLLPRSMDVKISAVRQKLMSEQ